MLGAVASARTREMGRVRRASVERGSGSMAAPRRLLPPSMRHSWLAPLLLVLAGCAALTQDSLDQRFGPADPTRLDRVPTVAPAGVSYRADVRPLLDRRCVVCHGCYDAPCQLKLGSWEGIARGTTKALVYDATRLEAAPPTRLFVDAQLASQWRAARLRPGAQRAHADAGQRSRSERPVPGARAQAAASAARGGGALGRLRLLAVARAVVPEPGRIRRLCAPPSAGRHALRSAGPRRARARRAVALARRRFAGRRGGAAGARRRAAGRRVGALPQRRLAQGAADEPLPVRAPVPRPPDVRGRPAAARVPDRALVDRAGHAGAADRDAPPLRRPGCGADVLPHRARARDAARQDAHALPAVGVAHDQVPRLVPRGRLPRRCAAVLRRGAGVRSVHHVRRDPARAALPLPPRRGRVLHHELHQGPGVPRADGAGRDRGPLLGLLHRPERRASPSRPRS